ncbi:MAG: FtsH protease activity modulator HflK [Zoogloeaceae bacterium]|jgi:membrane protease subunit HflK|nr:FtsH protease activity modulator HflK [Zoogloeaceae bacterium]
MILSGLVGIFMSTNDPQWGNNGGGRRPSNPPDFDELWSDLKDWLGFPSSDKGKEKRRNNNGGGDGGEGDDAPRMDPRLLISIVLGLAFVVWAASGIYIVDASQRGLVLRFGKYVETTQPGLQWRLPYPFATHEIVNVSEVRSLTIGYRGDARNKNNKELKESLMLTSDENIIDIQFAVQYRIKDAFFYQFKNRDPDAAVMQVAETAVREVVGKRTMDVVINEERTGVTEQVSSLMQEILDRYETGIEISKVTMQNAQPPEQVQAAFEDAVKAVQDKTRQENEGQAYYNDVVPKAEGQAAVILEEASAYKERMIETATGDASRFSQVLTEYAKAPGVTRQRLYLETLQQVYANTSKVMVDAKGQGNLLYLPLDQLMQAGAGGTLARGANGGAGSAASSPQRPEETTRSPAAGSGVARGELSREREAR